ncbi:MAG: hypothetical protein R2844_12800 [Caldilineales bacterium]
MPLSPLRNHRPHARRIIATTGLMALALVALSACGPATPEPSAAPIVQRPTFTPTSAVDLRATEAAAAEATALAMVTDNTDRVAHSHSKRHAAPDGHTGLDRYARSHGHTRAADSHTTTATNQPAAPHQHAGPAGTASAG